MKTETQQKTEKRAEIDANLAKRWGCDTRTIRRWRREGAPLESEDERSMITWLSGRRRLPAATEAILSQKRRLERAEAAKADASEVVAASDLGPAAALKRLSLSERQHWQALERAVGTGDPAEIRIAREGWLRVVESLRRCDLALEESRRGAGELVERQQVERLLKSLGTALAVAIPAALHDATPTLHELAEIREAGVVLRQVGRGVSQAVMGWAVGTAKPWPTWSIDALTAGFAMNGDPWPEAKRAGLEELVRFLSGEAGAQARADLENARRAFQERLDSDWTMFQRWRVEDEPLRGKLRSEWCELRASLGLPVPDATDEELAKFPGLKRA